MRSVALATAVAATTWTVALPPAMADERVDAVVATELSADKFLDAFDDGVLAGLAPIGLPPAITADPEVDARIRALAEERGYRRRATPSRALVVIGSHALQPDAAAGWAALEAAATQAGHSISVTSAFRSHSDQTESFRSRITGTSDIALDAVLALVAPPGYSRHHTGYAIDVRSGGAVLDDFLATPAYAWLAADNFANAKTNGWIPSYPDGSRPTGPDPEPWEFVWVGIDNILCAGFENTPDTPFCDTVGSTFAADITWLHAEGITTGCREHRYCTDDGLTRAQGATMLWRMSGSPEVEGSVPYDDVPADAYYTAAVRWMAATGITTGTTPTTFSPDQPLTRAMFVTLLWRLAGRPAPGPGPGFADVAPSSFAANAVAWASATGITNGTGPMTFSPDLGATRGQAAAFLHRYDLQTA